MVAYASNASTQEVEARKSEVQGHPPLQNESEDNWVRVTQYPVSEKKSLSWTLIPSLTTIIETLRIVLIEYLGIYGPELEPL